MSQFREAYKHIRDFPTPFWVVLAATFINQLGNMAFVYLMVYTSKALGFTLSQAAMTFAMFGASTFLVTLLGGNLIDKIGAARVMVGVLIGNGITLLIIPYFHDFNILLVLCFIWGIFFGLFRPASQTFISFLSAPGMHKLTFSVYRLVLNLGMSVGPVVGGYLAIYSFSLIFITNGIENFIARAILFFGLESEWFKKSLITPSKGISGFKYLKQDKFLRNFTLALIPVTIVFFQHESTLPVFINETLKWPLSFYGWLLTVNTLLIVFCELPLNILTMNWSYRMNFILGSFLTVFAFMMMYFVTLKWQLIMIAVCWTLGEMILLPAASSYIADIAPVPERGTYMSLYNATFNFSLVFAPLGGAFIMQHLGAFNLWLVCGAWGFLSVVMFWFMRVKAV